MDCVDRLLAEYQRQVRENGNDNMQQIRVARPSESSPAKKPQEDEFCLLQARVTGDDVQHLRPHLVAVIRPVAKNMLQQQAVILIHRLTAICMCSNLLRQEIRTAMVGSGSLLLLLPLQSFIAQVSAHTVVALAAPVVP